MADEKTNPFVGFLRKAYPFMSVAASLGGPAGEMAANMLGKALGIDVKPDAASIASALTAASANPDQLLAAQKAEQDFQLQMQKMGFEDAEALAKTAADDRASARNREIQTKDSWTPRLLAAGIVAGWMIVQWFLLHNIIPDAMQNIVMRSLGTLDMALGLVLGYYFGSSAGSAAKDDTIRAQVK